MLADSLANLEHEYDRLWDASSRAIRAGVPDTDPLPTVGGDRWGLSVVFRLSGPVQIRLAEESKRIAQFTGGKNISYDAEHLHTTVVAIGKYCNHNELDEASIKRFQTLLTYLAQSTRAFSHRFAGLSASGTGVMAKGWPQSSELETLRDAFREALFRCHEDWPERAHRRTFSHASLAVFTESLVDGPALADHIEQNRNTFYGETEVSSLELVSYDRTDATVKAITHASVSLG